MTEKPSVVFLIPFASRQVRTNWSTACKYLEQTIRSIRNSANQNYRVIVAGNEEPELEKGFDGKVHFLSVNNQFPSHLVARAAQRSDKLAKIGAAWTNAKSKWQPKYVMKLDADDFISSRLVGWLDDNGTEAGYLIRHGWLWHTAARHLIQRTEYIDRVCGSCLIIRTDVADRAGPFLTEAEGMALGPVGSSFAMRDHYSLVPGSGTTTLLLNDTHQRYAAQFRTSDTSCTRFLSMASPIESAPTALLASLAIALTSSVCGCAWELFGGQGSSRKSSGKNSCLVDWKIEIRAMLRQ
jgi:hypothetical protein